MSEEEVLNLAAEVRTFCQEDMKAFAFLSLYLQISVAKSLESKTWETVEKQLTELLGVLEKEYPANTANTSQLPEQKAIEITKANNQSSNDPEKSLKLLKDSEKFEEVKFEKEKSAYETL